MSIQERVITLLPVVCLRKMLQHQADFLYILQIPLQMKQVWLKNGKVIWQLKSKNWKNVKIKCKRWQKWKQIFKQTKRVIFWKPDQRVDHLHLMNDRQKLEMCQCLHYTFYIKRIYFDDTCAFSKMFGID